MMVVVIMLMSLFDGGVAWSDAVAEKKRSIDPCSLTVDERTINQVVKYMKAAFSLRVVDNTRPFQQIVRKHRSSNGAVYVQL